MSASPGQACRLLRRDRACSRLSNNSAKATSDPAPFQENLHQGWKLGIQPCFLSPHFSATAQISKTGLLEDSIEVSGGQVSSHVISQKDALVRGPPQLFVSLSEHKYTIASPRFTLLHFQHSFLTTVIR